MTANSQLISVKTVRGLFRKGFKSLFKSIHQSILVLSYQASNQSEKKKKNLISMTILVPLYIECDQIL